MEKTVVLRFPFSVENVEQISSLEVAVEHKEKAVSLSLPFELKLSAKNATLELKKAYGQCFIYVFKFCSLSSAEEFLKSPVLDVEYEGEVDCELLEKEMNKFMEEYEGREQRHRKKVKVYDEEGFYEYR